jgi:hypothetical protein
MCYATHSQHAILPTIEYHMPERCVTRSEENHMQTHALLGDDQDIREPINTMYVDISSITEEHKK